MSFIPLPEGNNTPETVRRLRALDAEFFGSISAVRGSLGDLIITGTLTLGSNGIFATAPVAPRWVFSPNSYGATEIVFESGKSSLYLGREGGLRSELSGWGTGMSLASPELGDATNRNDASISVAAEDDTIGFGTPSSKIVLNSGSRGYMDTSIYAKAQAFGSGDSTVYVGSESATGAANLTLEAETLMTFKTAAQLYISVAKSIFTGPIEASTTNVEGTPAYSFFNDNDTGMYRVSANVIGWSAGAARRLALSPTGLSIGDGSTVGLARIKADAAGTNAAPAYHFVSDEDTGMYRVSADVIGFSAGGARRLSVSAGAVVAGSATQRTPLMKADGDGQVSAPSYSFFGDDNTGMYSSVADHLQLTAGGTQYLQIDHAAKSVTVDNAGFGVGVGFGPTLTAGYIYNAPPTTATGTNAHWLLASGTTYYLSRSTSSARYKSDIKTADWLADIALRPVQFWSNTDEIHQYGLIAEEVVDAIGAEAAELNGEGQVENYDTRAVLAVLVAKVNKLEREIAQLRGDR